MADGEDPQIQELGASYGAIFKERLAIKNPMVLHRSPPLSQCGLMRLLFALNPAETTHWPWTLARSAGSRGDLHSNDFLHGASPILVGAATLSSG